MMEAFRVAPPEAVISNKAMIQDSIRLYKRLLPFILPYWRPLLLAFICMLPLSLCSAGIAYLVKPALDEVFIKKDMTMLKLIPLAIVTMYSAKGLLDFLYNYLLGYTGNCIINDLRNRIYAHLQTLSPSFFHKNPTGVLMSRITNDVSAIQLAINTDVTNIFKELLTTVWLVGVLFYNDYRLALVSLFIFPWATLPILRFGKKTRRISTKRQEKIGRIAMFMHETITGCRIVKAFGMEEYENRRFAEENNRLFRITMKRLKVRALSSPTMEFIGGLAGAAVIFYGGYNVLKGYATPGTFFSFVTALLLLYGPVRIISTAYQDIQEGLAAARRVLYVLDAEPDVREAPRARPLPALSGRIVFNGVWFAYDSVSILRDIHLTIRPGELVAVVGATGSGKTTLVNMIPRFFDPTRGCITIDGYDISQYTLYSLRSQIALVSQSAFLFNDTVLNNIAYGNPVCGRSDILAAAQAACADEFIRRLPRGYETVIGEHGEKLSGGQRQRIAIARAVLKDAPILILDEATSSLDSRLEDDIQQSIARLVRSRTTCVISHRLSTIKNADRIVVISDGVIAEDGSHEELFKKGGAYAGLYSVYLEGADPGDAAGGR